jgi:hypothetical protein
MPPWPKASQQSDTAAWNKKLSSFTEVDPQFNASVAKGISAADTAAIGTKN